MVLEMPAVPEYISVPECDDSSSDDDVGFMLKRGRFFSGILTAQARAARAKEEAMLYCDDDLYTNIEGELEVTPDNLSLREYLLQAMLPEWRKEIESPLIPDPDKKDEDVEISSPWPEGYEAPEARLKLLQREVKALCCGEGFLNVDNLKPDSQDFVDGVLDCAFEVAMGRCAMAEAKAAKRRAKRHRKREMENLRRCMDLKRKHNDFDVRICRRRTVRVNDDADKVDIDIDVETEGKAELKEENYIDGQVKEEEEEAAETNKRIKDEMTIADGARLDAAISISRVPCTSEEISAEQRELLIEFDDDDDDSSDEECMDTCPEDESMRSSSLE